MTYTLRLTLLGLLALTGCSLATDFERFHGPDDDPQGDAGDQGADSGGPSGLDGGTDAAVEGQIDVELREEPLGVVSSEPAGIDCGTDCSEVFETGTSVVLTATPGPTAIFVAWGGACEGQVGPTCSLVAGAPLTVSAVFTADWHEVIVSRLGSGAGSVRSTDGAIVCDGSAGEVCAMRYPTGTSVRLEAQPADAASTFTGWSGSCAGAAACDLELTSSKLVNAVFELEGYVSLLVSKQGNGNGNVSSDPAGIDCGSVCAGSYAIGGDVGQVTLTAVADDSSTFVGFSGDCTPQGDSCLVADLNAVKRVSAEFKLKQHDLTIAWSGSGSGEVVATSPSGLSCSTSQASCASVAYDHGTTVTLMATAAAGSTFRGWSLDSCGTEPTCDVPMLSPTVIVASFDVSTFDVTTGLQSPTGSGVILCSGMPCEPAYVYGTELSFDAEPSPGWELTAWSGDCAGTPVDEDCALTVTKDTVVLATFSKKRYTLTVSFEGDGSGSVAGALDCDSTEGTCTLEVEHGASQEITLTASPDNASLFAGWGGDAGCGGLGDCTISSVAGDLSVVAQFFEVNAGEGTLVVSKSGKGSVTAHQVLIPNGGIDCGPTCTGASASFPNNAQIVLSATAAPGYTFAGFAPGQCTTQTATDCFFGMDQPIEQFALVFTPQNFPVSVSITGSGNVSSNPSGINCGQGNTDCSESRPMDSTITLTATPAGNSTAGVWGGACAGVLTPSCELTVDQSNEVSINFPLKTYRVEVVLEGTGVGGTAALVTSSAGIACQRNGDPGCSTSVAAGSQVTLVAAPPAWADFGGVNSSCTGSDVANSCTLSVESDLSVTATFTARGALVFLSRQMMRGSFGGAEAADQACATFAQNAGLPGPWYAWLSEARSQPLSIIGGEAGRMRAITYQTPIVRVDGAYVMQRGLAQLERGKLDTAIELDELGALHRSEPVWTATLPSGVRNTDDAPYCTNWQSTGGSIAEGIGDCSSLDAAGWTFQPDGVGTLQTSQADKAGGIILPILGFSCGSQAHLYCLRDIK